ncbi:unnamed protein product [Amoebophrya sp. A25]|nr:unnamed protein product [Amoebophrya sp. A25]|eukprot:GSA25T00002353001.1
MMLGQFARRALKVRPNAIQSRALGTAKRGKDILDVNSTMQTAQRFFTNPALTYVEFKYQCDAVRFFAFWGLTGLLTLDLIVRPLKSSYFCQWGPTWWPSNLVSLFYADTCDVFLQKPPTFAGTSPGEAASDLSKLK